MAKDSSFDVVSQVDMQEMDNAVNQTKKEIAQRYDFRGSDASIELEEKCIKLAAEDEYKLNAIIDMLRARMAKRDIPLRCLELGKVEPGIQRHSSPDTYYPAGYTEGKSQSDRSRDQSD